MGFPGGLQKHETIEWERLELSLEPHSCLSLYICFIMSLSYLLLCSISVFSYFLLSNKIPETYWLKTTTTNIIIPQETVRRLGISSAPHGVGGDCSYLEVQVNWNAQDDSHVGRLCWL